MENDADCPDEIPESELDIISDSQDQNSKFEIVALCLYNVDNFLNKLNSIPSYLPANQSFCHTILSYGQNSSALRLVELIFGMKIARKCLQDVHLIRNHHLPNLVEPSMISELVGSFDNLHYMSFLRIYYVQNYQHLVKHLLNISTANKNQLLPVAFIIDDIHPFIRQGLPADEKSDQDDDNEDDDEYGQGVMINPEGPRKRIRLMNQVLDEELLTLMRCCSLLAETIEYCAMKLKQNTYFIMNIDLTKFYSNDVSRQQNFLNKLKQRYFRHQLNVDDIF